MILGRAVFHPVVFAVAFVLERTIHAALFMAQGQAARSLVAIPLGVILLGWIIQRRVRDWHRTGALVFLLYVTLLGYHVMVNRLKVYLPDRWEAVSLCLLVSFAAAYALCATTRAWRMIRRPTTLTSYLNVTSLAFLGLQLVQLPGVVQPAVGAAVSAAVRAGGDGPTLAAAVKPDIYVIVLDGYARQDVLRELYRHDNSAFLGDLEARGFYVAREASSNYVQTAYAIAALLNFDYVSWWPRSPKNLDLENLVHDNRTFHLLRSLGYRTVAFDTGFAPIQIRNADLYLSPFLPLNDFEPILLINTPVEVLSSWLDLPVPTLTYTAHRRRTGYVLDALGPIASTVGGPKVVYAHVVAPHPPFVRDEQGRPVNPRRPYVLGDGSDWPGTRDEYRSEYPKQVRFVNRKILAAIDAIVAASAVPPVIVLLGDHGPGSMFAWDHVTPGCLWERTSSLLAVRLPDARAQDLLYPSISPVNVLRVVFNAHFGAKLPRLEDKTFLTIWHHHDFMIDVTARRNAREACEVPARPDSTR